MIGASPFSEVRLNEALENACAKVLDYKVHKDKIKALRYEKSMLNFYVIPVNIICPFSSLESVFLDQLDLFCMEVRDLCCGRGWLGLANVSQLTHV